MTEDSMRNAIRRRTLPMAVLAVLLGLQAPLCALACLEQNGQQDSAQTGAVCHGPVADPETSESSSHETCGCDFAYQALVPASDAAISAVVVHFVALDIPLQTRDASMRRAAVALNAMSLPPPDILLLKATLLI